MLLAIAHSGSPSCRQWDVLKCADMIRVWRLSGEQVAQVDMQEFPAVRTGEGLKRHLRLLYGFPMCQQELFKDSCRLTGSMALTGPCDVQLSLWPWNQQEVADELTLEFSKGNVENVRSLLAARAHMDLTAACRTAVMNDSDDSCIELVRLLIKARSGDDVSKSHDYSTALLLASESGHAPLVQLLVGARANINLTAKWPCKTALMLASELNHVEVVRILVDARADMDAAAKHKTALVIASEFGHVEVLRLLVEARANVDAIAGFKTALMSASQLGHIEAVRLLVEARADMKSQHCGKTALMYARESAHVEIGQLLVESGAKV